MIDAYLDESGIHDKANICVIAGYFGGPGQIKRFGKAWKETLKVYSFPMRDFHAKDLVKQEKHRSLLGALAQAIAEHTKVCPVRYGLVVGDFMSFSLIHRRFMTGARIGAKSGRLLTSGCPSKPYFVPFQNAIKIVTDYTPVGGKARFSFGLNKPFAEYALALSKQIRKFAKADLAVSTWRSRDRLGEFVFPPAEETAPLQAADLLVHLTYRHMEAWFTKTALPIWLSELLRVCLTNMGSNRDHVYQDRTCLQDMIDQARALVPGWDSPE